MNKLKKLDEFKLQNDHKIIGFRNRLIQAYDSIDNTIVWTILKRYIPLLKKEVDSLSSNSNF